MTDWTAATPTLANGEYPTSYLPVRVPGAPDLFKQAPIARFVTTDANGKTETASTVTFAFGQAADAGTIVGGRGAGGSLVVRTASLNVNFDSGMAIDGSFNAQTLLTAVNLTAFGVFSGGGYQADMVFRTSVGQTISERMRLTAGGNLGIGTAAPVARLSAHATNPARGILQSIRNDGTSGLTGAQIQLTQNSIADWAIGQVPGVSAFGVWRDRNTAADGAEMMRIDSSGHWLPGADNSQNLGSGSKRMGTLYAGTGSINTSDEREKRTIEAIPDDWLDAWGDVEWLRFRFVDGRRWHAGLVAQRVHAAFAARGLDAFAIGLCCHDRWDEERAPVFEEVSDGDSVTQVETGETRVTLDAGDRWGLRYDECFAMEAAWHRREVKRQDARLASLEAGRG